jgi:hypothetical protein
MVQGAGPRFAGGRPRFRTLRRREFWLGASSVVLAGSIACLALWVELRTAFVREYELLTVVPSPDGEQHAILYVSKDGRGECDGQYLAIAAAAARVDPRDAGAELDFDFSASCESNVSAKWLSEQELEVSYSIDADFGTAVYQRAVTPDGRVRLRFVPGS